MRQLVIGLLVMVSMKVDGQSLPVTKLDAKGDLPLVFFVSGDGGLKGFTLSLVNAIHDKGYPVAMMDAKTYFWNKKTPDETAAAIAAFVAKDLSPDKDRKWVMAGYSFGADITPFVINRLPDTLKRRLLKVILLSPSTSTDFEIHLSDMLGLGKKRSMEVIQEINKMNGQEVILFRGKEEYAFPAADIRLSHFRSELIKGDHHYGGDYKTVADSLTGSITTRP